MLLLTSLRNTFRARWQRIFCSANFLRFRWPIPKEFTSVIVTSVKKVSVMSSAFLFFNY